MSLLRGLYPVLSSDYIYIENAAGRVGGREGGREEAVRRSALHLCHERRRAKRARVFHQAPHPCVQSPLLFQL